MPTLYVNQDGRLVEDGLATATVVCGRREGISRGTCTRVDNNLYGALSRCSKTPLKGKSFKDPEGRGRLVHYEGLPPGVYEARSAIGRSDRQLVVHFRVTEDHHIAILGRPADADTVIAAANGMTVDQLRAARAAEAEAAPAPPRRARNLLPRGQRSGIRSAYAAGDPELAESLRRLGKSAWYKRHPEDLE